MKLSSRLLPPPSTALDAVDEAGAPPCYFVDGGLAEGYHTCDVKSPVSSCCPSGYTCSGSSLCILTTQSLEQPELAPGTVSRGACTEPRWNGDSCGGDCLDSEDATGETECDPAGGGRGEKSCCAGGNAPGGCICSSNVAVPTLVGEAEAQTILGRRTAPLPKTTAYQVRGREARLHHPSKTVSPGFLSTEAGLSEMFPGYSSWVRTSSSLVSAPISAVTPPTWSGVQSETTVSSTGKPSEWIPTSQFKPSSASSTPSTENTNNNNHIDHSIHPNTLLLFVTIILITNQHPTLSANGRPQLPRRSIIRSLVPRGHNVLPGHQARPRPGHPARRARGRAPHGTHLPAAAAPPVRAGAALRLQRPGDGARERRRLWPSCRCHRPAAQPPRRAPAESKQPLVGMGRGRQRRRVGWDPGCGLALGQRVVLRRQPGWLCRQLARAPGGRKVLLSLRRGPRYAGVNIVTARVAALRGHRKSV
ncbi:hypothetical protein F5883DRAFT_249440 [Diaporthe sp. PMI_573]|nr:hypothetical protein F5883DRAFT_249440 [Diaporthaceae sp. PMI_573]